MCLSSAYAVGGGSETLLAERLTGITIEEDKVKLTNLFGGQITVEGKLKSVDLEKNIILIETKQ